MTITTHDPKQLQQIMRDRLIDQPIDVTYKPMFGGIMAYADGQVFASLSNVGLAIKLAAEAQAELLAIPDARRLQYELDMPPSKSYIALPDRWLSDADHAQLIAWLLRSAAYVKSLPAKKRKA